MKHLLIMALCFLFGMALGIIIIYFSAKSIRKKFQKALEKYQDQLNPDDIIPNKSTDENSHEASDENPHENSNL